MSIYRVLVLGQPVIVLFLFVVVLVLSVSLVVFAFFFVSHTCVVSACEVSSKRVEDSAVRYR